MASAVASGADSNAPIGLIDRPHVDHMHPDAVIAIAAAADGERLTREILLSGNPQHA